MLYCYNCFIDINRYLVFLPLISTLFEQKHINLIIKKGHNEMSVCLYSKRNISFEIQISGLLLILKHLKLYKARMLGRMSFNRCNLAQICDCLSLLFHPLC